MTTQGSSSVPLYHVMPVVAFLGTYSIIASVKALLQIYLAVTLSRKQTTTASGRKVSVATTTSLSSVLRSKSFLLLVASILVSTSGYGFLVARVNRSLAETSAGNLFDPYGILHLSPQTANTTQIKIAYRTLSRKYHPGNQENADDSVERFEQVQLAFKALTDEVSNRNWKVHGHPNGPNNPPFMQFAVPTWLLKPQERTTGTIMVGVYILMFAFLLYSLYRFTEQRNKVKVAVEVSKETKQIMGQAQVDIEYFDRYLNNQSTHMDVLFYIATCPDLIRYTATILQTIQEQREKKIQLLQGGPTGGLGRENETAAAEKNASGKGDFDLDDSGWADDVEEENEVVRQRALRQKQLEEEKKLQQKQLAAATGKVDQSEEELLKLKFEGLDDGAIGQKWVEGVLQKEGAWPPTAETIPGLNVQRGYFEDGHGQQVSNPLDVPVVRRNLCILLGRLNSQALNTHSDLVAAGPKGLIDGSYFRHSMEFRQRNGLLLEAALRMALANRSYELAKTIIEAMCMFKIGTSSATSLKNIYWFNGVILETYGGLEGLPRLKIDDKGIETPGENEIATGDACVVTMTIERTHAQKFLEHKLELCKKQNMDPRVALAAYQEVWWVLVRAKCSDDEGELITAWPFVVRNIAQKAGKVKCKFQAPEKPGRYKFIFDVKSQDFLGADQSFELEYDIVDRATVERNDHAEEEEEDEEEEAEEEEDEEEEEEEEEGKKDK